MTWESPNWIPHAPTTNDTAFIVLNETHFGSYSISSLTHITTGGIIIYGAENAQLTVNLLVNKINRLNISSKNFVLFIFFNHFQDSVVFINFQNVLVDSIAISNTSSVTFSSSPQVVFSVSYLTVSDSTLSGLSTNVIQLNIEIQT